MIIYEAYMSGWESHQSFGLFLSKESAINCMHEEAKKYTNEHNAMWENEEGMEDVRKSYTLVWKDDFYHGELDSFFVTDREVLP